MRKILSLLGTMALSTTTSAGVVACSGGETPTPPVSSEFQKVTGWTDTNGAVVSLISVGNDLYAGTITADDKGKLFKITSAAVVSEVTGWTDTNGAVVNLISVGNDLYAGTITASAGDKGKLFKITSAAVVSEVTGWTDTNGGVYSLISVGNDLYAGTITAADKGNLYKSK